MKSCLHLLYSWYSSVCLIIIIFISALSAHSTSAQSIADSKSTPETRSLFTTVNSKPTGVTFQKGDIVPITINPDFFAQPIRVDDELIVPFISDESEQYRITGVSEFIKGIYSVRAVHVDNPFSQLTFSYGNGRMHARIDKLITGDAWLIRPDPGSFSDTNAMNKSNSTGSGRHLLEMRDPEAEYILECGFGLLDQKIETRNHQHDPKSKSHLFSPQESEFDLDANVPIDILVAYTTDAKTWADSEGGGIETVISQMMNKSQLVLENSNLDIELRLVHIYHTDFQEDGNASVDDLKKITVSADYNPFDEPDEEPRFEGYAEEIHELRDEYGADLVAVLADIDDVGGLAWLMNNTSGIPQFGFSINNVKQVTFSNTFIHEIGHNLGNQHSRIQTEAPADAFGGLFDFATGWRFNGNNATTYATVMTYAEGSTSIPYFSNPDFNFDGAATGSYTNAESPADNVRNMLYSRHIVSNYRLPEVDPPAMIADNSEIVLAGFPDDSRTIRIPIENTGHSVLHWSADVAIHKDDGLLAKMTSQTTTNPGTAIKAPDLPVVSPNITDPGNAREFMSAHKGIHNSLNPAFLSQNTSGLIFETGFEQEDGYNSGEYLVLNGWASFPRNSDNLFSISHENSKTGSHHLRLTPVTQLNQNNYVGVQFPFSGALISQPYSISMDLHFSHDDTANWFYIIADESSTKQNSALAWFENGGIRVSDDGESFYLKPDKWQAREYFNFEIQIDPVNDQILYLINDNTFYTGNLYGGSAPENILLLHRNYHTGETFDIDNIIIKTLPDTHFPRFQLRKPYGALAVDSQSEISLTVITDNIPEDDYEFNILLHTNDPFNQTQTIPVRYQVTMDATSSESESIVSVYELTQNYPNPFNPLTAITYRLPVSGEVRLDVMNITGQHIITLVNEQQQAGEHTATFDATGMSSGVYLYRLQAGPYRQTRKMVLIK